MKISTSKITAIFKTAGVVLQVIQLVVAKIEEPLVLFFKESIPCPWWIPGKTGLRYRLNFSEILDSSFVISKGIHRVKIKQ